MNSVLEIADRWFRLEPMGGGVTLICESDVDEFIRGNQACPNVFRGEPAVCRLDLIPGPSEYAKALYRAGFSRTG
jgi:hypothetical protein